MKKIKQLKEEIFLMIEDLKQNSISEIGLDTIKECFLSLKTQFEESHLESSIFKVILNKIDDFTNIELLETLCDIHNCLVMDDTDTIEKEDIDISEEINGLEKFIEDNRENDYYKKNYEVYCGDLAFDNQTPISYEDWLGKFYEGN